MSFKSKYTGQQIDKAVDRINALRMDGEGLQEKDSVVSLAKATKITLGGIKTGFSESDENYAVHVDSEGNAYVHVPKSGMFIANSEEDMNKIASAPSNLGQVVKYVGLTGKYNQDSYYLVEEDD